MFTDRENEELTKLPGQINGNSFVCRKLSNCTVYLCDYNSAIYIDDCSNTQFYFGPTSGSVFMRNCDNCSLTAAAEQIRISDSSNIDLYAFSLTDIALEKAVGVKLAPYNFAYSGVDEHFERLGFRGKANNGFYVHDFTPAEGNYSVMPVEEFRGMVEKRVTDEDDEVLQCPVDWPAHFGGSEDIDVFANREIKDSVVNPDGSVSFQINVSQQEAEKKIHEQFSQNNDTIQGVNYTYTDDSETVKETLKAMNKGTDLRSEQHNVIEAKQEEHENRFVKKREDPMEVELASENDANMPQLQKELKNRNDKINARLEQKLQEERKLKEERKRKAKRDLDNFLTEYKKGVEEAKVKNGKHRQLGTNHDQQVSLLG